VLLCTTLRHGDPPPVSHGDAGPPPVSRWLPSGSLIGTTGCAVLPCTTLRHGDPAPSPPVSHGDAAPRVNPNPNL